MPPRTILLVVGAAAESQADVDLVAATCEEAGAHLSVLVLGLASPPPIGAYAAMVSDAWMEERQAEVEELEGARRKISEKLSKLDISADATSEYAEIGWADEVVGRHARYADLTIVGPALAAEATLREKVVAGALFFSGKPLLILPKKAAATLKPKQVMIAWDARPEASRAVREALEILAGASSVHVVIVDPNEGPEEHGMEPGADIGTYLARHGVKVVVDRLPSESHVVATVLRRHARDMGAGMIVMGGYGHSRLRERVFGGVTREMLEDPPVPILMAR